MRIFALTLMFLFLVFQYTFWSGKNGVFDLQNVSEDTKAQASVNLHLEARNKQMYAEIADLRQGFDAIEERARHELGMIKEGETFYRVVNEDPQ